MEKDRPRKHIYDTHVVKPLWSFCGPMDVLKRQVPVHEQIQSAGRACRNETTSTFQNKSRSRSTFLNALKHVDGTNNRITMNHVIECFVINSDHSIRVIHAARASTPTQTGCKKRRGCHTWRGEILKDALWWSWARDSRKGMSSKFRFAPKAQSAPAHRLEQSPHLWYHTVQCVTYFVIISSSYSAIKWPTHKASHVEEQYTRNCSVENPNYKQHLGDMKPRDPTCATERKQTAICQKLCCYSKQFPAHKHQKYKSVVVFVCFYELVFKSISWERTPLQVKSSQVDVPQQSVLLPHSALVGSPDPPNICVK